MSEPVTRAFVLGKAFATVLREKAESALTDVLSDLGRIEAQQRETLRQFTHEVVTRADQELQTAPVSVPSGTASAVAPKGDLQETIDELRAEIAEIRAALKVHAPTP
ncbi:MAG: DUF6825 family protein [Spirulinaceae cyanobacterium]